MKISLGIVLIFSFSLSFAQESFSKFYDFDQANQFGTCIKQWGDDMAVFVPSVCDGNTNFCSFIMKLNQEGDTLWTKRLNTFRKSAGLGFYGLEILGDNLLVGLTGDPPGGKQYIDLRLLSPEGDSLWSIQIKRSQNIILRSIALTDEGNIICGAHWYDWNQRRSLAAFFIKINQQGDIIWERKINDHNQNIVAPISIFSLPNEEFLVSVLFCEQQRVCGNLGKQLWYMDKDGHKIWTRTFEREPENHLPSVVGLDNGNFVMSYNRYEWPDVQLNAPACIQGENALGDSIWDHCFLSRLGYTVIKLRKGKDGNILGCGSQKIWGNGDNGWLFKMNPQGEVLWERNIYYDLNPYVSTGESILYDITEDDEGNLWVVGDVTDTIPDEKPGTFTEDVWIMKLTPDGCLIPGCTDERQIVSDVITNTDGENINFVKFNDVHVFPNPTNALVTISVQSTRFIKRWRLFNSMGKLINQGIHLKEQYLELDLSKQMNGFYYIGLTMDNDATKMIKILKLKF